MLLGSSMEALGSSQDFVRALKSSSDPPSNGSPLKIQLARLAWDNTSFYIPRKAGVILEWLFTRFQKEKGTQINPLTDSAHWDLLADVLRTPGDTQIEPLVSRLSISNLLLSFLQAIASTPTSWNENLLASALAAFQVLWPISLPKTNLEAVTEPLWTYFSISSLDIVKKFPEFFNDIGTLLLNGFQLAFENTNTAGKKKVFATFSQSHFHQWVKALHLTSESVSSTRLDLFQVGTTVLLYSDGLRASLDTSQTAKTSNNLVETVFADTKDPLVRTALLQHLPRIYEEYIKTLRKHRASIFPAASSAVQFNSEICLAAFAFAERCLLFVGQNIPKDDTILGWKSKLNIIRVMEEHLSEAATLDHFVEKLREVASEATALLDNAWDEAHAELSECAYQVLCCLFRIEPDLVLPSISHVLERLATTSSIVKESALVFLKQLIEYHSRVRTLHDLISSILTASVSSFSFLPFSDAKRLYAVCHSSPLYCLEFADELTGAFKAFATPAQAKEIVTSVQSALEASLCGCIAAEDPGGKRRKVSAHDKSSSNTDSETEALKFGLTERIAGIALPGIFSSVYKKDEPTQIACLSSIDELISEAMKCTLSKLLDANVHVEVKSKKRSRTAEDQDSWARQSTGAVLLRLWYDVFLRQGGEAVSSHTWKTASTLGDSAGRLTGLLTQDILPDLQVEIIRFLYARETSKSTKGLQSVNFGVLLDYFEANLFGDKKKARKDSTVHSQATQDAAVDLWSFTLERHLRTIDGSALEEDINRFVSLIIRSLSTAEGPSRTSPSDIIKRIFGRASFWEAPNIRISMLSTLQKETQKLASVNITECLEAISKDQFGTTKSNGISLGDVETCVPLYRLLHYFPSDYLSRSSRIDLATRALTADVLIKLLTAKEEPLSKDAIEWRATFRSFLAIVAKEFQVKALDDVFLSRTWLEYLTRARYSPLHPTEAFIDTTISLISMSLKSSIHAATRSGDPSRLATAVDYFLQANLYMNMGSKTEDMLHRCLLTFIRMVTEEANFASLSEDIVARLKTLQLALEKALIADIERVTCDKPTSQATADLLEAWHACLLLRRKVINASEAKTALTIGPKLLAVYCSPSAKAVNPKTIVLIRANILSILAAEGALQSTADCDHVANLVAGYIVFTSGSGQEQVYDKAFIPVIKSFSTAQYGVALDLVADALQTSSPHSPQLSGLLHLSRILHEGPEGTSKLAYEHSSRCLGIFVNQIISAECPSEIVSRILNLIQTQCVEKAASLRSVDVSGILSILAKLLGGSTQHEAHTSSSIFQSIVYVANSIVRQRRDLLSPLLPHLAAILRQLLSAMRAARPLLGTKQYRLIADTLPSWINLSEPLSENDAQALTRLLTALTTKSMIRTHGPIQQQKTESLARPFARHAPYVLLAYLQIMNDPLSRISVGVRRELEPGLFALCAIMGEHGRDTLMVQSLDVGGKSLFKTLWKEYDRQKYVGKG
ncbi:hypothetical protein M422DRAFT_27511 [Sphaerobolus stellatus SS14]|nr:hypothetical protein M422DRAFT_27511 [Sphaerobolus stellatus SS14]